MTSNNSTSPLRKPRNGTLPLKPFSHTLPGHPQSMDLDNRTPRHPSLPLPTSPVPYTRLRPLPHCLSLRHTRTPTTRDTTVQSPGKPLSWSGPYFSFLSSHPTPPTHLTSRPRPGTRNAGPPPVHSLSSPPQIQRLSDFPSLTILQYPISCLRSEVHSYPLWSRDLTWCHRS